MRISVNNHADTLIIHTRICGLDMENYYENKEFIMFIFDGCIYGRYIYSITAKLCENN